MRHYDLVIIGTGSGNSIPGPAFDDWDIAIVEQGTFGGTCLNVGCIPTKMYVHPADLASGARHAGPLGVTAHVDRVDWASMRDRIFGRIDPIAASGKAYREGAQCPNITVYTGTATFTGHKALQVAMPDGTVRKITADRFVLAAGSRADVPDIPGLVDIPYHTSDTVMRIDNLPDRVVIIGGGDIAAEFAHIFASFGSAVTQVVRGPALLRHLDDDVSAAITEYARHRYAVHTGVVVDRATHGLGGGVTVHLSGPDGVATVDADLLLIATGRTPNGDLLQVGATGVSLGEGGRVVVDDQQQTANHEARVVAHNLQHPEALIAADHRYVPAAVFTEPQIATVGITERDAVQRGIPHVIGRQEYGGVAAGWAREDTTGFAKVIADPASGLLLGAHIIGPEAATVIQPLIQAMHFGVPAHRMARGQYWIHPALPEVVENALLALPAPTG